MSLVRVIVPETEAALGVVTYPDATAEVVEGTLIVSRGGARVAEYPEGRYSSWTCEEEAAPVSAPEPEPEPESPPAGA